MPSDLQNEKKKRTNRNTEELGIKDMLKMTVLSLWQQALYLLFFVSLSLSLRCSSIMDKSKFGSQQQGNSKQATTKKWQITPMAAQQKQVS